MCLWLLRIIPWEWRPCQDVPTRTVACRNLRLLPTGSSFHHTLYNYLMTIWYMFLFLLRKSFGIFVFSRSLESQLLITVNLNWVARTCQVPVSICLPSRPGHPIFGGRRYPSFWMFLANYINWGPRYEHLEPWGDTKKMLQSVLPWLQSLYSESNWRTVRLVGLVQRHKRSTRRFTCRRESDSVLYMEPRQPPTHGEHNFELLFSGVAIMANKSCRCCADVSSLHTQVTSVATQMPRKACIICQQGLAPESFSLETHHFCSFFTLVWWKNTFLGLDTDCFKNFPRFTPDGKESFRLSTQL